MHAKFWVTNGKHIRRVVFLQCLYVRGDTHLQGATLPTVLEKRLKNLLTSETAFANDQKWSNAVKVYRFHGMSQKLSNFAEL